MAQPAKSVADWSGTDLLDVVKQAKPTILIGVSGQRGLFTEDVIKALHAGTPRRHAAFKSDLKS